MKVKPANKNLLSVNEKEELQAQKEFYDKIERQLGEKKKKKLEFWRRMSLVYLPVMALIFVCLYWLIGLKSAGILWMKTSDLHASKHNIIPNNHSQPRGSHVNTPLHAAADTSGSHLQHSYNWIITVNTSQHMINIAHR